MKSLTGQQPEHARLDAVGRTVSVHAVEAGHKIHDDVAPKVAAAAEALHSAVQTAAERSRPIRVEVSSRGSAALAGLLGDVTPAQIERMSRRAQRRRGKTAVLLAAAGGAVLWALWWRRSDPNAKFRLEEVSEAAPETADDHGEDFASPPDVLPFPEARRDS